MKETIKILMELSKFRITVFVGFSTSVGFILAKGAIDPNMIISTLGVFFLACSSSALNHLQEKDIDGLMERTKNRPLPSGRISKNSAVLFIVAMFMAGSVILYVSANLTSVLLGWLAYFWYNAVYTPLKKSNALAVIPGSLIGAIPPMIGWAAAGGNIFEPQILALSLFFFIWQIPHFWLLLLLYGKEYEKAGFPSLTKIFNNKQLMNLTFLWIVALSICCLLIPFFGFTKSLITTILLVILGVWLIFSSAKLLYFINAIQVRKAFLRINMYILFVVLLLSIDKLVLI